MKSMMKKRLTSWGLIVAMLVSAVFSAQNGESADAASKVKVTYVNPAIPQLTLKVGEKFKLKMKVSGKKKKLRYSTSNRRVAKITSRGVIRGVKKGKATVSIFDQKKKKIGKIKVTVVKKFKKVKKVKLNKKTATIVKGDTVALKAVLSPKKATVKKVVYISSNPRIAKVSKKGNVVGRAVGTTKITAYAADGRGAKATFEVNVKDKDSVKTDGIQVVPEEKKEQAPSAENSQVSTTPNTPETAGPSGKPTVPETAGPSGKPTVPETAGPSGKPTVPETAGPSGKPTVPETAGPSQEPATTPSVSMAPAYEVVEQTSEDIEIFTTEMTPSIYLDKNAEDIKGLTRIANSFAEDVELVSGVKGNVITDIEESSQTTIIAGVIGDNDIIDGFIRDEIIDVSDVEGKWESYRLVTVKDAKNPGKNAIVVAGSDKRGVIYGIYHISELMGVSPWAYWGDVVTPKVNNITIENEELNLVSKEPSVKYRGIFLNDEAPSLTGWATIKFGGYNEKFYEHVYELILRLKGNYMWPAMWDNCFSVDGTDEAGIANAQLADEYGVVMGTSHHEPMCRAGNEWSHNLDTYIDESKRIDGKGSGYYWNYDLFPDELTKFWEDGVKRNKPFENVYTIGMRGEADSAIEMSTETFKNIITTQKSILKKENLEEAPNVLVLYKEIEQMWYEGDGTGESIAQWPGLDDTTIMFCEDNFGNMRTLPNEENRNRKAGWGMYYHFDYHGSPRSYEWVNTVPLHKTWEQMSMAYDYGVDEMWIVNVGDLKPMEMNISYFLDMAYDFDTWGTKNKKSADEYTANWVKQQFGSELDENQQAEVADVMREYLNLNGSRKPEIVLPNTYSVVNHNEVMNMLKRCENLINKAQKYMDIVSEEMKASYFQLVYYPAVASANVNQMQLYAALNEYYYNQNSAAANLYGTLIQDAVARDESLTNTYNKNMYQVGDKWQNMMSSPHVGYTHWDSEDWSYPQPKWVTTKAKSILKVAVEGNEESYTEGNCALPNFTSTNQEQYWVSISNGGGNAYDYTVTPSEDWILCSKKSGTVSLHEMLSIGVDWDKVTENKVGKVTVAGAGSEVEITVTANITDVSGLEEKTYVEDHGYVSIDVSNYTDKKAGGAGATFEILENYGKYRVAAKAYPTTERFENYEDAPYLEYKINVASDHEYTIATYTAPSNNVDWNQITLRYGISVDGGEITTVDTIDGENFAAGDHKGNKNTWSQGVMENIRMASSNVQLTKGTHTLRFYAKDPALVLEKIVVYSGELKMSYFGPNESYYVGKEVDSPSYTPEYDDNRYNLPGVVPTEADKTEYPVIMTENENCQYKVVATGDSNGEVALYMDGVMVGVATVTGEGTFVVGEKEVYTGASTLSYEVIKGNVNVSSIKVSKKRAIMENPVYVSASSGKAEFCYDDNEDTIWTPTEEDMSDGETSITLDWKETYSVDHFEICGEAGNMTSYDVQLYNGNQFETVYTGTGITDGKAVYIQGKEEYKGSKIRFVFHDGLPKIQEILITPYINWATEDMTTITGHKGTGEECDIPASIVDGDRITKALESSTMGTNSDVVMEFQAPRRINAVNVVSLQEAESSKAGTGIIPDDKMTSTRAQTAYTAYYYANGKWNLGGSVTQSDENKRKVLNTIEFSQDVMAEKVKVVVKTSYWVRIVELEPMYQYKNSLSNLLAQKQYEGSGTVVSLEKEAAIGRIKVCGLATPDEVSLKYMENETDEYIALDNYDIWEEADGFSILLKTNVMTKEIQVSSSGDEITSIQVWEKLPNAKENNEIVLHQENFENGKGSITSWGSPVLDVIDAGAYEGKKALYISKRNADYCTAALGISNFVDANDNTTEYTVTYYAKSASGDLKIANNICNSQGVDVDLDGGKTTTIHENEWTKVEYRFVVKSADYQFIKIVTSGDEAGEDGYLTDFYLDHIQISKAQKICTCIMEQSPEFMITEKDMEIPKENNGFELELQAIGQATIDSCQKEGHETSEMSYHYTLLDTDCENAQIQQGKLKLSLGDKQEVYVILKVDATVNNRTRSYAKKFTVRKSNEYSEGYANFALSSQGTSITASQGENNAKLVNLIDGNKTENSNTRWRTNVLPAYLEVTFDKMIGVSEICVVGQDASHPIKACSVSYLKDGEWIEFENGSMTENAELEMDFRWDTSIKTPAIRIDLPKSAVASNDGWARLAEIEVWGKEYMSTGECECQIGIPKYTGETDITIPKEESTKQVTLTANAITSTIGCQKKGHDGSVPTYSYEIVSDVDGIASIENNILTLQNKEICAELVLSVKAEMNEIIKESQVTLTVRNEGYENYLLTRPGVSIATSDSNTDAANLVDGNNTYSNGKRWRTQKYPTTIDLSLGEECTLNQIDIFTQQDSTTDIPTKDMVNKASMAVNKLNLYYWNSELNDGAGDWALFDGGAITDNNKVWIQHKMKTAVTTTKVRVEIPERVADGWARLVEIQVWGGKMAAEPVSTEIDLSQFASKGNSVGSGNYDAEDGTLTYTFASEKERLYFPLTNAQINEIAKGNVETDKVKITIDATINEDDVKFDTGLMGLGNSNWNGTKLGDVVWGTTTTFPVEYEYGFNGSYATTTNFSYVMLRLKDAGKTPTVVIKKITVSLAE